MKLILAALAVLALTALPASAGRQVPFALSLQSVSIQDPVEQQTCFDWSQGTCDPATWTYNPTPCAWDHDDHFLFSGNGYLDAGSLAQAEFCAISDDGFDSPKRAGQTDSTRIVRVTVTAASSQLQVRLRESHEARSWAIAPELRADGYVYTLCILTPSFTTWPEIPGSNGGYGVRLDYSLEVSNSTPKRVRGISASFQLALAGFWNSVGCP